MKGGEKKQNKKASLKNYYSTSTRLCMQEVPRGNRLNPASQHTPTERGGGERKERCGNAIPNTQE